MLSSKIRLPELESIYYLAQGESEMEEEKITMDPNGDEYLGDDEITSNDKLWALLRIADGRQEESTFHQIPRGAGFDVHSNNCSPINHCLLMDLAMGLWCLRGHPRLPRSVD